MTIDPPHMEPQVPPVPDDEPDWPALIAQAIEMVPDLDRVPVAERHLALADWLGISSGQVDELLARIGAAPAEAFEPDTCGNTRFGYVCQRAVHDGTNWPELEGRVNLHATMTDRGYLATWIDGVAGVVVRRPSPEATRLVVEAKLSGDVL